MVPAVSNAVEERLTNGGVKTPYMIPRSNELGNAKKYAEINKK